MSQPSRIPVPTGRTSSKRKESRSVATQTGVSLHNSFSSSSHELAQYATNLDEYYDQHVSSTPTQKKNKRRTSNDIIDLTTSAVDETNTSDLNESIETKKKQTNHNESLNSMSTSNANENLSKSIHLHSHDRTLLNYLQHLDLNHENINNENDQPNTSFHDESQLPTTSRNVHLLSPPKKHFKKRKSTKRYSKRMPKETYNNYDEDADYFRSFSLEDKQEMLENVNERIRLINDDPEPSQTNHNEPRRRSERLRVKTLEKLNRQKMELIYLIRMDQQELDYQTMQDQEEEFDVNLRNVTTKRGSRKRDNNHKEHGNQTRVIRIRNIEI